MRYVYYDPDTMQIMAEFDTPILSVQENWAARGLSRAIVADGVVATRDHKIEAVDDAGTIIACVESTNTEQPAATPATRMDDLRVRLAADTITDTEIRELLRLERGL